MPSLASWIVQGTGLTTFSTVAAFFVYTKHCHFTENLSLDHDVLRNAPGYGKWFSKFNPERNPILHDECVRRVPLWKIRKDLLEDAEKGGSKLVEAFTGGIWGRFGYAIQRKYLERKYRNDTTTAHQLWNKDELLKSNYETGTQITDHFDVLSKEKDIVIIRCGDSPLNSPGQPRPSDGLVELGAKADLDKGYAEFRMRCLFYKGLGKTTEGPMGPVMDWLHKQYTKLLVESAMGNCLQ